MHDKGNLSRRGFMQQSLTALTLGAGLPAWFARELFADDKKVSDSPSEKLLMGAIGFGAPTAVRTPSTTTPRATRASSTSPPATWTNAISKATRACR